MNEWDRQPQEPGMWFSRFDRHYRPQGPERTLVGAYRLHVAEKEQGRPERTILGAPTAWKRNALAWRWRERAEAWDAAERERRECEAEEDRQERREEEREARSVARTRRRQLLDAFVFKIAEAMQQLDSGTASFRDMVVATKEALDQMRAEYDDLPTQRQEVTGAEGEAIVFEVKGMNLDTDL